MTWTSPLYVTEGTVLLLTKQNISVLLVDDETEIREAIFLRTALDYPRLKVLELLSLQRSSLDSVLAKQVSLGGLTLPEAKAFIDQLIAGGALTSDPPKSIMSWTSGAARRGQEPMEDMLLMAGSPRPFLLREGKFVSFDSSGTPLFEFTARELFALLQFKQPVTIKDARISYRDTAAPAIKRHEFDQLVGQLLAAGMIEQFDPDSAQARDQSAAQNSYRDGVARRIRIRQTADRIGLASIDECVAEVAAGARDRVRVVPISSESWSLPPLALGYLMAYAEAFEGGRLLESYVLHPAFLVDQDLSGIPAVPSIYLFSNYVWSFDNHMEASAQIKLRTPGSITIHGGPSTPKYPSDTERFFRDHPHIDIAVHGEGEQTFVEILAALESSFRSGEPDLNALRDVPGLSYRKGDGCVRTADRERITDLNDIPSPILGGHFDMYLAGPVEGLTIETNRGCPYGCTFCDWGSATLSRIRKFDIERVFAEIEWAGQHQIKNVGIADANFGIIDRDVAIAEWFVTVKEKYGYPTGVGPSYAKNTVKHLRKIIEIWADGGLLTEGRISLQSTDEDTLEVIRRRNIKTEQYNKLAIEFRENKLPLAVELMMGLPGATYETFKNDLQEFTDRDLRAMIHPTLLLPNSPMNDPEYKDEHGIVAEVNEIVRETKTYSRQDWLRMRSLRAAVQVMDMCGIGRYVLREVRSATGRVETSVLDEIITAVAEDPASWPALGFVVRSREVLIAPGSWRHYLDELRRFVEERYGLTGSALDVAFQVQEAHLPDATKSFPIHLDLVHDYAAWHAELKRLRFAGHKKDWQELIAPLDTFGPGTMVIEDRDQVSSLGLGQGLMPLEINRLNFELFSPVSKPWYTAELLATSA